MATARSRASAPAQDWDFDETPPDEQLTGEAVALTLRPTGFALRAAGAAIDFIIYFGTYVAILVGLFTLAGGSGAEDSVYGIIGIAALVLCAVIAPATVELLTRGKSVGKLVVGARIVRDDGGAIGLRHAAIRGLVGSLEIFSTFGGLAALVGLVSPRTKRLGDLIAGTYSQYERVSGEPLPVFGVPGPLVEWARTADVARMPDAVSRRIAQFLSQAPKMDPARRRYLASQLASEVSVYVSPLPAAEPELFLAGVTVVRRERELAALMLEQERLQRLEPALRGLPHAFPDRG